MSLIDQITYAERRFVESVVRRRVLTRDEALEHLDEQREAVLERLDSELRQAVREFLLNADTRH